MAGAKAPNQSTTNFSKSFSSRRGATLANNLPHELLVHIFETAQNTLLSSKHIFRFPLVLGAVSQYWRQVAFTAPKLWLNVDISHPRDWIALQGYVDRSKHYPIDLHLSYVETFTKDLIFFDAEATQLIAILQPHYSRCRSIKFLGTYPNPASEIEMKNILRSISNSHLPILKRFLVQLPERLNNRIRLAFRCEAPNLTSVFLRGLGLSYCRPPLNAVTELHLAVENKLIDDDDFFEILQACAKSLITLCTYDNLVQLHVPAGNHSISMPCLRHLRIFGTMHKVSELLLLISAPDLEELTIAPIILRDLATLLLEYPNHPKFPALKSLTLAPAHRDAMGRVPIYASACFPGIELLILPTYHKPFFMPWSSSMNDDAPTEPRWPRLHSLAVCDVGGKNNENVLLDLVADRQRLALGYERTWHERKTPTFCEVSPTPTMRPKMRNAAIPNMMTREPSRGDSYVLEYSSLSSKTVLVLNPYAFRVVKNRENPEKRPLSLYIVHLLGHLWPIVYERPTDDLRDHQEVGKPNGDVKILSMVVGPLSHLGVADAMEEADCQETQAFKYLSTSSTGQYQFRMANPCQSSSVAVANLLDDSEITRNLSDFKLEVFFSDGQQAAPANELPPELLVHIFEIAQNMLLPSEHLFGQFPLVLGGVSHYWRQVAFGAPMLWLNVDISHPRDLTVLRAYLDRSKGYPIDLHLTYDAKADPINADQLIGIVQPHYFHCRSIRLNSGAYPQAAPGMVTRFLKSMRDGHYPMLQSFLVEGDEMHETFESCAILNDAPNLTDVRLGGLGLSYCRPPLKAVTKLHLAVTNCVIPYTDFSKMLQSCESLITLCIYDDLVDPWPSGQPLVHIPSLRCLRIFGNMTGVSEFLLSISVPDLEELTIAPIVSGDLAMLQEDISHNTPRFPALKSLTLAPAHAFAMEQTLGPASMCFPGIGLLILPNYYSESFLLSFMTDEATPSWPGLHTLAVRDIDGRYNQDVLYEFVEERQRLGVPLGALYLDSSSIPRITRMDWLKGQLLVVEADPWRIQSGDAFYSDEQDRFVGSGGDNINISWST
ncbi:uncharacterized protein LACBIDRAFT_325245 [Laccaria bicolor S238N-H82]|uniref:Predicted protein n=1 Tax=Laccaria bicolor (strain S238N-H82 / ATCC MYA-4686) TaxID=486041 RepID=B0D4A8_LACBS|nr:uncharacterized protein LACBIDRAFT_325245 [Laccaria bicolor S238N-H82]EDR10542.1 predicted protein [Laccaria bicolor S238N-H82]|eukprot:XP_001878992.1 predicted protein [Laccaria bicolor S238N-H82]